MKTHAIHRGLFILGLIALDILVPCFAAAQNNGGPGSPQDELRSIAPNVYLDCERRTCDFNYIKTEITFVNYVLDRQSADVQIIVTRQQTGSGGNEYTLAFLGLKKHKGRDATLRYYSKPTDTEDQFRQGLVNVLKQGLIPYVYDTPLAEFISISYAQKRDYRPTPESDPWHYWVFGLGLRGNGEFETQTEKYSYQVNLSANRTTEKIKFRFYASTNYNHRVYDIPDEEPILSISKRKNLSTSFIRSIDVHWSWGASASLYSSTYDNARLYTSVGPAVEYNIYPYSEATRRELRIQYRLSFTMRDYYEITIFDKEKEDLFSQALQVVLEIKEPWGSIGASVQGQTFLHDLSKNNLRAEFGLDINLFKGFSFNVSGRYTRIRDQISLPGRDFTPEEILLELRRLATGYNLRFEVGLNYRFGSIYSNVVNPRFGNM
ncbi:MAG: hypothetical protein MUQ25_02215 [Candidatus Aminicenantes bacterium]|nr:hypothetical protein [Candidatus Aminicenantes bacterium]MCJ7484970.1 hypothetical protein [Candidatus Aminicenantes bacterium]TFG55948.1 MAG: hypothetical protein E4H35_05350 [Candidatus Aminicenantes bacterium]